MPQVVYPPFRTPARRVARKTYRVQAATFPEKSLFVPRGNAGKQEKALAESLP